MIEVPIGEAASYAAAGVDLTAGDATSSRWHEATVKTYENRPDSIGRLAMRAGTFSSVRGFDLDVIQGMPGLVLVGATDGAGTKPEIAEQAMAAKHVVAVQEPLRDHRGIPRDVAAMCIDDLARDGIDPFALYLLYDTNSLTPDEAYEVTVQLAEGAVEAAAEGHFVFMGGESAELGNRVGGYGTFNYNLGGFAMGIGQRDRIITGENIIPGQHIVAIRDRRPDKRGFRSNGMSLVRKVMTAQFDEDWHLEAARGENPLINSILTPSDIFAPTLVAMHGGYDKDPQADVRGIVHVTGGGLPGKLQRLLAVTGLGAVIPEPYEPNFAMREIQEFSMRHKALESPDPSIYQTLNMGMEMLVVTPDSDEVSAVADRHGKEAKVIGEITAKSGIEMVSQGNTNNGEWLRFVPAA